MKLGYPLALLVALGLVGACSDDEGETDGTGGGGTTTTTTITTTSTDTGTTTTTTTGGGCGSFEFSDEAECQDCLEGSCCDELLACNVGSDCATLFACVEACDDDPCVEDCVAQHQGGLDDLLDLYDCADGSCAEECASGICGTTLAYQSEELTECATEHCCASFDPCYADAACTECLMNGGEGAGCDSNALYLTYRTCMDANCPTSLCETDLGYQSIALNACINANCCDEFTPCEADADCYLCLTDPDAVGCDENLLYQDYETCKDGSCPTVICTTSIGFWDGDTPQFECNQCAGVNCCEPIETCVGDGSDPAIELCIECLNNPDGATCTDAAIQAAAEEFNGCIETDCSTECA